MLLYKKYIFDLSYHLSNLTPGYQNPLWYGFGEKKISNKYLLVVHVTSSLFRAMHGHALDINKFLICTELFCIFMC